MKLMFCGACGDVVSPGLRDMKPRWCQCGRHAVWWRDGDRGLLSVHDREFPARNGGAGGRAWVIGLHNGLLRGMTMVDLDKPEDKMTSKQLVEQLLAETPDSYLFKRAHSLAVRIAPGYSNDTMWEEQP